MKKLHIFVSIMVGVLMFILGTKAGEVVSRMEPSAVIEKEISALNSLAQKQRIAYEKLSKITNYDKSIHEYIVSLKNNIPTYSPEHLGEQVEAFNALSKFRHLLIEKVSFDASAPETGAVCSEILSLDMEMSYHQQLVADKISY